MPNRLLQLESARAASSMRAARMRNAGKLPHSAVREMLSAACGKPCPDCSKPMARWLSRRVASLDHIVPVSKGGSNEISNLRVICNRCNARKGNR
jgi:5-methylcytosine-specific restriction endonuclease McrA